MKPIIFETAEGECYDESDFRELIEDYAEISQRHSDLVCKIAELKELAEMYADADANRSYGMDERNDAWLDAKEQMAEDMLAIING